jgi:hypothetical protein
LEKLIRICQHQRPNKISRVEKKNEPENLTMLCRKCHSKTKKDREYWKIYFQDLMKNKKGS